VKIYHAGILPAKTVSIQTEFMAISVQIKSRVIQYKGEHMNRFFSTLTVFAILLIAVGLSIRQSLEAGSAGQMLALQAFAGVGLVTGSVFLIRRRYFPRINTTRAAAAVARPIRRLLSSVWS